MKKMTIKLDIKRILAYSAIKIRANLTAPYSILNPDTSSDSPSAKSKGVRLVSAKHETTHNPITGINIISLLIIIPMTITTERDKVFMGKIRNMMINANLISYEIV